jgi:preprotein translocase subunit SecF
MPDYKLINLSISESLNRTVMTVSTVVIVLVIMLIFGGSGLYDFALVLLIGVVKGTYSSLYIASPLLYLLHERARKKGKAITYRNTGEQEVQPMLRSKN